MGEEEDAALTALLEANGYSTDDADSSKLAGISSLEMFLQDYPKMAALSNFGALTELRLLDQRIEKIEGLHGCPKLKKLWLIENRITVIENLEPCTALQELYLTSNRITEITGISNLTSLQVLWLADNYISSITGLSQLADLRQLNLARNDIAVIGNSLQQNTDLTSLNLADNRISSMRDVVSGLSCLSSLQDLCFGDPFWGVCPITSLSNYQTFMLAHLPQLTSLDTLGLAQETKAVAAATFAKKQLYYNMRNRTLGRALGDLCRAAEAVQQAEASKWLEVYARLVYVAKPLMDDSKQSGPPLDSSEQQVQQKVLQDCMQAVTQQLMSQRQCVSQDCRAARVMLQAATSRLQLELGSAGNIWLEEGHVGDAWVQSCQELLRNSSNLKGGVHDGKQQLAGDIQILTATRIHNRHLRAQFSQQQKAGPEDFQYLFFSDAPGDFLSLAEHGFDPVHSRRDPHTAVRLSSCLPTHPGNSGSSMQVLVCRACLAGPCKALPADGTQGAADGQPNSIDTRQYPGLKALYRNLSSSSNSGKASTRLWYICDHTALLPEYIITYQHADRAPAKQDEGSSSSSSSKLECMGGAASKDALLHLCARPLQVWLDPGRQHDAGPGQGPADGALWKRCRAVLATMHKQQPPRLPQLTSLGLQTVCGGQQLAALTRLSFQDCGRSSFAGLLCHLPNLVMLALPFNSITSLEGLAQSAAGNKLAVLDVSHNSISTWSCSWLQDCTALMALDASCNKIAQPADLQALSRSAPQLRELDLRFNPAQYHKAYSVALSALSSLIKLDGLPVQQQDPNTPSCLTLAELRDSPSLWHSNIGPVCSPHTLGADDWRQQLHSVVLDGRGLRGLAGLAAAHALVAVNLADNLLSDVADLSGCTCLQQLNISNNLVSELRPLSSLSSLRQLDVSCNQMSSLSALSHLTSLTSLSCEGNAVASLAELSSLVSLVELYAAHNAVKDIKEVERLSVLPNLIVLDLLGNPVVSATEGYRLLLLFKLRALKVLDGMAADAAELAAAQAEYAGRLTLSLLEEELLPGCELSTLKHLDLTAAGIKDLGTVFAANGPLAALTGLTLDSNHLTSISPLSGLTRLMSLHINGNKPMDTQPSTQTGLCFEKPCSPDAPHSQGIHSLTEATSHPSMLRVLLPALQTLQLAGCGLTSLVPLKLQCLPALRSLFVQGNELSKLDGLGGLVQLRELVADKNRLRVFEPEALSSCVRLQELRLEDNLIRSISPACSSTAPTGLGACLPALRVLRLASNRMMDAGECAQRLADIPCLEDVTLAGNPFVRKQQAYRQLFIATCSQLQAIDSQPVTEEEREVLLYTAAADSPRVGADMPQYTAAMLLAAAAAASAGDPRAGLPLGRAAAGNFSGQDTISSPKAQGHANFCAPGLPTMLNFEGHANLTTARQNLLALGATGSGIPGMMGPSVPSIQSGVLVLTGPASFGLEGTSMRGSSSSSSPGTGSAGATGAGASPHTSPSKLAGRQQQQQQASPGGAAGKGSSRRTTTGSIASYRAGGFVVRQATFQY